MTGVQTCALPISVTLRVNDLDLRDTVAGSINAGANTVQITPAFIPPAVSSRPVTLGDAVIANTLSLSSAELGAVTTTGLLTVGDATHTGAITVTGAGISLTGAGGPTGGLTVLNNTGGIAVNSTLTYTKGAGNLTLTANGGGATTGAITDNSSGLITATNLTFNAASGIGTAASPMLVTGTNVAANNTTSGGVFLLFPTGDANLTGLANGSAGTVALETTDGSINVSGTSTAAGPVQLTANDTAGSATDRNITIGATLTTAGYVALRAADSVTVNANVDTTGGTGNRNQPGGPVLIVAGNAPGMSSLGAVATNTELAGLPTSIRAPATETAPDTNGSATFNAKVITGTGNIIVNATGPVTQPATGPTGLQNAGDLIVRTYNSTPNPAPGPSSPGPAFINLQNGTAVDGNANGNAAGTTGVVLDTRLASDASAPLEPAGGFAASSIDYKGSTGLVLKGVGTAADFIATATEQDITLATLAGLQARNLVLIANDGDVKVNAQVTNDMINRGDAGGSLQLYAADGGSGGGNIVLNPVDPAFGVTIGKGLSRDPLVENGKLVAAEFDHSLAMVAENNIVVRGGIMLKGDLQMRADASNAEANRGAVSLGNGVGAVIVDARNLNAFRAPGVAAYTTAQPVELRAANIIVGTNLGGDPQKPLPVGGLQLFAETNAAGGGGVVTATGNRTVLGDAVLRTIGRLEVYLSGDLVLTGGSTSATSILATDTTTASSRAALDGNVVTIRGLRNFDNPGVGLPADNASNIIMTGGTAAASNPGIAKSDASALVIASRSARIEVGGGSPTGTGGDITINGGNATASGGNALSIAMAGTRIGTQITGDEVLQMAARNIFINSGTRSANPITGGTVEGFGSIAAAGAIRITVTENLLGQGLVLDGAGGTGMFDALGPALVRVSGSSYPITVSGRVEVKSPAALAPRTDALVVAGAPLIDESLLAAFLRATEATRAETFAQDPNLQQRSSAKGQPNVCK